MLVVDDEADIRELLDLTMARMGLAADTAANVAEAKRLLDGKQLPALPDRHAPARRRRAASWCATSARTAAICRWP
ncbi:MAG: hypothetical protein MZW92_80565 [Comamonadaceae bacterium]|nr:hypothetical protein [Comamonadaceae bacterium]